MSDADDTQARRTMFRKTVNDLQTAANLRISKRFFKNITGGPNTFYCNIDSEILLRIIAKGGGLLVDEASKASYILSEDPSKDNRELPMQFIIDCVIKNKLLDKDTYISSKKSIPFKKCRLQKRLYNCENHVQDVSPRNDKENTDNPSGSLEDEPEVFPSTINNRKENIFSTDVDSLPQTLTNHSKKIAINNDKAMDWFFDQTGPEINNQSVSSDRKRKKYTLDEDLAIIRHLIRNKIYASTGGDRVWRTMEHQRVTTHTWGSMKARLKKVILVNMNSYGIPALWKAQLTGNLSFIEDDDMIEEYESPPLQNSKSCDTVEREKSRKALKRTNHDIVTGIELITAEEEVGGKENERVGDSHAKETNLEQIAQSSLQFGSFEPIQFPARKKQRSIKTDLIHKRKKKPYGEEANSLTSPGVEFDESDSSFSLSTVYEFLPQNNSCSKKNNNTLDSELEENAEHISKPHSHQNYRNERSRETKKHKSSHASAPNKKVNISLQFKISFLMDKYDLSLEEAMYLLEKKGFNLHQAIKWFHDSSSDDD